MLRQPVALFTLTIALVLAMAGCTDGEDEPSPSPDATTEANGGDEATAVSGGSVVGAVAAYVTQAGLDGETFEVTETINCRAFAESPEIQEATGKVCIDFTKAEFTDLDGLIGVEVVGTERTWQLTLELRNLNWVVTGAEYTGQ